MTTLLQRCLAVTTKVQQLTLAQRHASQQRLVQERTREWKSRYDKLKLVRARAACLSLSAEAWMRIAEKREYLRHNAAEALERLRAQVDLAQLTEDAAWTRLLASVEGLTEELESSGRSAWKSHIDEQGALEDPAWLRNRAPPTPINDAAIDAYRRQYDVYAGLVKLSMPRSAEDVAHLSQVIAACRSEAAKITLDVPSDVQRFFRALQLGSATLGSVTPDVLQWLADNGQLERYRVRSAGQ